MYIETEKETLASVPFGMSHRKLHSLSLIIDERLPQNRGNFLFTLLSIYDTLMMKLETILYIIQVTSLVIALACTLIMMFRVRKAVSYMDNYIREHQNKKGIVSKEFRKVIKILGGK